MMTRMIALIACCFGSALFAQPQNQGSCPCSQKSCPCMKEGTCPCSTEDECTHLATGKERDFAAKLSPMHRTVFCRQFTLEQRDAAIAYFDNAQMGQPVTQDEAVEMVLKSQRAQKPMPSQGTSPTPPTPATPQPPSQPMPQTAPSTPHTKPPATPPAPQTPGKNQSGTIY